MTSTLRIERGKDGEVQLQFTIPFINQLAIVSINNEKKNIQTPLTITIDTRAGSLGCDESKSNPCGIEIEPYKKEAEKNTTDDWGKKIHRVKIYNKHDGDFSLIDKHVTLRFKTTTTEGKGSKIFENITLSDIQVNNHKS